MKLSGSQTYRWPFGVKSVSDAPEKFVSVPALISAPLAFVVLFFGKMISKK
jgi:hypothetical protein